MWRGLVLFAVMSSPRGSIAGDASQVGLDLSGLGNKGSPPRPGAVNDLTRISHSISFTVAQGVPSFKVGGKLL